MALVAFGCSTPKNTGYLDRYAAMHKGQFLEQVFVDQTATSQGVYSEIVLGTVSVDGIRDQKGITADECRGILRKALVGAAETDPEHPVVLRFGEGSGSARLDVAITEMSPGSAGARMFAGELGAGHAWVQIEGRVVDPEADVLLFSFAERRRSSAAIGVGDVVGDAGPGEVRKLTREIAGDLVLELRATFGG